MRELAECQAWASLRLTNEEVEGQTPRTAILCATVECIEVQSESSIVPEPCEEL
jgi:hypothetical protein